MPSIIRHRVPNFLPTTKGLHFPNRLPEGVHVPLMNINIPVLEKRIPFGDASKGLCGGMVFTVRDYFEAGLPIPKDEKTKKEIKSTPTSGKLYNHIARRLIDSFNLFSPIPGPTKYMHLMHPALPDGETWASNAGLAPRGRAWVMIKEEWPKIKVDLDNDRLSPVVMILIKSDNPFKLGENHQVLAYGYELDGNDLSIHIYDPNYPDKDNIAISLNIADAQHATEVHYSRPLGGDKKICCFLRTDYSFSFPPLEEGMMVDIHLIANNNQYLSNKDWVGSKVMANSTAAKKRETFQLIDPNGPPLKSGDLVALRANNGRFVRLQEGDPPVLAAKGKTIERQETFTIIHADGSGGEIIDKQGVAFRANNGLFVCAEGGGGRELVANRSVIGHWETFIIEIIKAP